MSWPEKHTVHKPGTPFVHMSKGEWRPPRVDEPYGQTFRTCDYCGSIHPGDLLEALRNGATMHGSDWKYGWPHKFYVEGLPNTLAGQTVKVGGTSGIRDGVRFDGPIMGVASAHCTAKFYSEHLLDEGYGEEERATLIRALETHTGIRFQIVDGKLKYAAPHYGYQR